MLEESSNRLDIQKKNKLLQGYWEKGNKKAQFPHIPGLTEENNVKLSSSYEEKNVERSKGNKGELKKRVIKMPH